MSKSKKCCHCKQIKLITEFQQNGKRGNVISFRSRCKKCIPKRKRTPIKNIKYKTKFPNKIKAYLELHKALRLGKLIKRPCRVCGEKEVEAHHEDYNKPLDIVWLCTFHHKQLHRKYDKLILEESDAA